MSDIKDIEHFALTEFNDLISTYGFRGPNITYDNRMTRIDYLKGNLGVEIELDWREFMAFLLIVRLENGKLPNGYYVSNGRQCRKHIAKVIKEQNWQAPEGPKPGKRLRNPSTTEELKRVLTSYKEQLSTCIHKLEAAGDALFAESDFWLQKNLHAGSQALLGSRDLEASLPEADDTRSRASRIAFPRGPWERVKKP